MGKQNISQGLHTYLMKNHKGRNHAVSSKTLEAVFHIKGAAVRKTVNSLRSDGIPICSDENGYYYAASQSEINATVAQLDSRIEKIFTARNGLAKKLDKEGTRWHENMN